jgi:hypothetical protein
MTEGRPAGRRQANGSQGQADSLDFRAPDEVAAAADKGLRLRQQFRRGGTTIGIARARDLKHQKSLSEKTVKRMVSYFARHNVDKRSENFGDEDDPSAGYIAWLLWGGDAGRAWAEEHKKAFEDAKAGAKAKKP